MVKNQPYRGGWFLSKLTGYPIVMRYPQNGKDMQTPLMDTFALGARPAMILNIMITSVVMYGPRAHNMVALAAIDYHHFGFSCTI